MTLTSSILNSAMNDELRQPAHLEADDLASFVDGKLSPVSQSRVEAHLATCDECRAEVIAVSRLMRARASRRRFYLPAIAAVAAALILFVVARPASVGTTPSNIDREPVITAVVAPTVVAPRGAVTGAPQLVWTSVPHADLYRITLFDDAGGSVWESQTRDTSAALPGSIKLRSRASYYWRIEAQTGWNRWVASDLIEFSIAAPGR